jgi:alanine-glyoxylate transaminase/serine-glyoxylate transaminase/serine-pyruvate transaminase
LEVETIVAAPGRAVDPADVEARLRDDAGGDVKAVLLAHADTASSVRNDVAAIRAAIDAADHSALLMVDAIATLACEPYLMDDWGVDVTVGASQKGLMVPPGLSFVWAGPRARAAHDIAGMRTRYWDWSARSEDGPYYRRFCGTPPVSHLFGLREALRMIDEEGLDRRWARHRLLADAVRAAVDAWRPAGLRLLAIDPLERADGVTTIVVDASASSFPDVEAVRAVCRARRGVTLGTGIGGVGPGFRIGHMGHVNAPMVFGVVGAIDTALVAVGAVDRAEGAAAAAITLAGHLA